MFPLNWNIPFINKNGSRTTLGQITGDVAGIESDISAINNALTNVEDSLSHRNLLDNGWFTINQRGQSSYTGRSGYDDYSVDRWMTSGAVTVNVTNNGITFPSGEKGFKHKIDNSVLSSLLGKTVTLSAMLSDGTIISKSGALPSTLPSSDTSYVTLLFTTASGAASISFRLSSSGGHVLLWGDSASSEISLRAVKLELGSVSTLAMDTAPNYATELLKCQRYFVRLNSNKSQYFTLGNGIAGSASAAFFKTLLPTTMRSAPSVSGSNDALLARTGSSSVNISSPTFSLDAFYGESVSIKIIDSDSGLTTNALYLFSYKNTSSYIDLSADL